MLRPWVYHLQMRTDNNGPKILHLTGSNIFALMSWFVKHRVVSPSVLYPSLPKDNGHIVHRYTHLKINPIVSFFCQINDSCLTFIANNVCMCYNWFLFTRSCTCNNIISIFKNTVFVLQLQCLVMINIVRCIYYKSIINLIHVTGVYTSNSITSTIFATSSFSVAVYHTGHLKVETIDYSSTEANLDDLVDKSIQSH
jgi:hypothetical protein